MKKVILVLIGLAIVFTLATTCLAKQYVVVVDDKYVEYFEKAFVSEKVTPSEWLGMQALNLADQIINQEYVNKTMTNKTRDEKIDAIKK